MNKLLCVVGATATGKTALAIKLHQVFPGILVSADSRQVYKGMDIVTGKDHPSTVTLHGIDLVNPDEDCSVAVWSRAVSPAITHAQQKGFLPIIVGGTGLYIRALIQGIATMDIPPNKDLRKVLESLSLSELQTKLGTLDTHKLASMNQSDRNNPRRLIRAIEIISSQTEPIPHTTYPIPHTLIIGLKFSDPSKYQRIIKKRVKARLKLGALKETRALLTKYPASLPAFTSLGYRHLIGHLSGLITTEELIEAWTSEEIAYAKRQLTWFNKYPHIHWFDAQNPTLFKEVATLAKDWYSNDN